MKWKLLHLGLYKDYMVVSLKKGTQPYSIPHYRDPKKVSPILGIARLLKRELHTTGSRGEAQPGSQGFRVSGLWV